MFWWILVIRRNTIHNGNQSTSGNYMCETSNRQLWNSESFSFDSGNVMIYFFCNETAHKRSASRTHALVYVYYSNLESINY